MAVSPESSGSDATERILVFYQGLAADSLTVNKALSAVKREIGSRLNPSGTEEKFAVVAFDDLSPGSSQNPHTIVRKNLLAAGSIRLAVFLLPYDSKPAHSRGSGFTELGLCLGCLGDSKILILHHSRVALPDVGDCAVKLDVLPSRSNSIAEYANKVAQAVERRIREGAPASRAAPSATRRLRVLLIDDPKAQSDATHVELGRGSPSGSAWTNTQLATELASRIDAKKIPAIRRGNGSQQVDWEVESRTLSSVWRGYGLGVSHVEREFAHLKANSLLRLKLIVSRFDVAVFVAGPDTREASKGGLASWVLGYWLGRSMLAHDAPISYAASAGRIAEATPSEALDLIYLQCDARYTGPSNFAGMNHLQLLPMQSGESDLAAAFTRTSEQLLTSLEGILRKWNAPHQSPSKQGPCLEFLRKRMPSLRSAAHADLVEVGYSNARVPCDMLAPAATLIELSWMRVVARDKLRESVASGITFWRSWETHQDQGVRTAQVTTVLKTLAEHVEHVKSLTRYWHEVQEFLPEFRRQPYNLKDFFEACDSLSVLLSDLQNAASPVGMAVASSSTLGELGETSLGSRITLWAEETPPVAGVVKDRVLPFLKCTLRELDGAASDVVLTNEKSLALGIARRGVEVATKALI